MRAEAIHSNNPNVADFMTQDAPSTSKAAAAATASASTSTSTSTSTYGSHDSCELNTSSVVNTKLEYKTNSHDFWTVLWHLDSNSALRMDHMKLFPTFNQTPWEWKYSNPENQSFSDVPFAKLLDMLSYKLIRRSPQLTDLLLKLLAHLSPSLPNEDPRKTNDVVKQTPITTTAPTTSASGTNSSGHQGGHQREEQNNSSTVNVKVNKISNESAPGNNINSSKIETPFYSQIFSHFKILIEVLTHKCGTSEGLESIARIIQYICQCSYASNVVLSQYLRHAILGLAEAVEKEIQYLLHEFEIYKQENADKGTKMSTKSTASSTQIEGGIPGSSHTSVLKPTQANTNLSSQTTAIKMLMASSSAQVYFLRTLKIFLSVSLL